MQCPESMLPEQAERFTPESVQQSNFMPLNVAHHSGSSFVHYMT